MIVSLIFYSRTNRHTNISRTYLLHVSYVLNFQSERVDTSQLTFMNRQLRS